MKRFSKITTTQLARICGVSQGTVDRALHNRSDISDKTRKMILEVAKEFDYVPTAKGGSQAPSMLIGVVIFDLYNEYFSRLAMDLVKAAKIFGYSILFQFSEKDISTEREAIEYFDYIGVDGIILFSVGSDCDNYRNYLRSLKKPLILIGNKLFDLPYIGIDDTLAMYELTLRFTEHTFNGDLVYYAPVLKKPLHQKNAQRLRLDGFIKAAKEKGLSYRIALSEDELGDMGALVCSTDHHLIKALKDSNYNGNIPLAGFDNSALLKMLPYSILTVESDSEKIATQCINYILGRAYESKIAHKVVYNQQ
ncbi:MAG: LacI family transcriptional regulator [Ruminococcaceae bacterium]|nr:LacI family transcriptional regulator [Oscillospiraceae bacterium]